MMNLLTTCFLMILTGHSTSEYVKSLNCPYESKNVSQTRIWCKRDDKFENCCTGFAFRKGVSSLENDQIHVHDDGKSFTVSLQTLTQGDGVYWCGLMAKDKTIVKLGEEYFSSQINFLWAILRWILFFLLSLMFISIYIYINREHEDEERTYEDIKMYVKE